MKAVVFHSEQPTDAIVRLTASAICGTDLHIVRGRAIDAYKAFDERQPGWIKVELKPPASSVGFV